MNCISYGDPVELSPLMAVIQTVMSFFIDDQDSLLSIIAKNSKFVFLTKGPVYLVAVSHINESEMIVSLSNRKE